VKDRPSDRGAPLGLVRRAGEVREAVLRSGPGIASAWAARYVESYRVRCTRAKLELNLR
jgi:hypothetical protein